MFLLVFIGALNKAFGEISFLGCVSILPHRVFSPEYVLEWKLMNLLSLMNRTCVSKPDLVTFLERMKDSRNISSMETTPIYPAAFSLHTQCVMPRNPGFEDLCPIETKVSFFKPHSMVPRTQFNDQKASHTPRCPCHTVLYLQKKLPPAPVIWNSSVPTPTNERSACP